VDTHITLLPKYNHPSSNDCERLFHGRGQTEPLFSHVCIDWFAPVILITLYANVDLEWLKSLSLSVQKKIPECTSIQVQRRHQSKAPVEIFWGEKIQTLVAIEHQLKYHINLANNQNHGLFLDIANGRKWLIENSKNKRVLNLFAYTCAFSVCAIAGGANYILNLDMSKSALSQGRENHKLNRHDLTSVKYAGVDLFKSWGKLRRETKFNLLVCDPPSFQKGSVNIERDYKKIIKRIPEFMENESDILLCLNSLDLDQKFILKTVEEYCPACHFIKQIENPSIFKDRTPKKALKVLYFKYTKKLKV
jgi:23S rRNA (cytosine1962-C5)-methyltransferase